MLRNSLVMLPLFKERRKGARTMHMADALVSPAVSGAMWAASAGFIGYSCKRVKAELDDARVPLMGVMGAFTFAAQMINFAIPATGSSGHLGGGLLLAILLGPHAAFLTMVTVLTVQAVFFADGGLLALGCNIFNLGVLPCFVAYPLVFGRLRGAPDRSRMVVASVAAALFGLELGALGVVVQTTLSGITSLPFSIFAMVMLPIHLAIGVVEGAATAAVVLFVAKARPELLSRSEGGPQENAAAGSVSLRRILLSFGIVALLLGGVVSRFASSRPDGLEWAIEKTTGSPEIENAGSIHRRAGALQDAAALLPDYDFQSSAAAETGLGTAASGVVGGGVTLLIAGLVALMFHRRRRAAAKPKETPA